VSLCWISLMPGDAIKSNTGSIIWWASLCGMSLGWVSWHQLNKKANGKYWHFSMNNFLFLPFSISLSNGRWAGKPYWRGRLSTLYLLVLTSLYRLLLMMQTLFTFLQNKLHWLGGQPYRRFPSVSVPCIGHWNLLVVIVPSTKFDWSRRVRGVPGKKEFKVKKTFLL
jgi:hypothetical protein